VLLFAVGLIGGMQVDAGIGGIAGLIALAVAASLAAALFSAGVAMRLRTIQAGPAMQMPVFLLLFIAPVYVPLALLTGWVKAVAHVNPVTPLLDTGRDLISGTHPDLVLAGGVALGLIAVFAVWAVRGLRAAEAAG
jgi:ABC-2 type transport system permease protein